jgi:hypothetical protein
MKKSPCNLQGLFGSKFNVLFVKLNVERQGEGGTLALNDVNITTRYYLLQVFLY